MITRPVIKLATKLRTTEVTLSAPDATVPRWCALLYYRPRGRYQMPTCLAVALSEQPPRVDVGPTGPRLWLDGTYFEIAAKSAAAGFIAQHTPQPSAATDATQPTEATPC